VSFVVVVSFVVRRSCVLTVSACFRWLSCLAAHPTTRRLVVALLRNHSFGFRRPVGADHRSEGAAVLDVAAGAAHFASFQWVPEASEGSE
jgi:hypothetical protein